VFILGGGARKWAVYRLSDGEDGERPELILTTGAKEHGVSVDLDRGR